MRGSRIHVPSLATALVIMIVGTLYPPLMADAAGRPNMPMALCVFWAMSAGFVRGVGFVPRATAWRWLFSGTACAIASVLAIALRLAYG